MAVIGPGALMVLAGWHRPARSRPEAGELPLLGTALWAGWLLAGGLWELSSLLQQRDLTATSDAHPTISALTDPLLSTHPGRSLVFALWLGAGWLVVRL